MYFTQIQRTGSRAFGVRLLSTIFMSTTCSAFAAPPFVTDDPEPVEYQHSELHIAYQLTKTKDGRTGAMPQIEYNYGPVPDVQVGITIPYGFSSPGLGKSTTGIGDIGLSLKYRFMLESDNSPMVAIFPVLITHTGDNRKGLGVGGAQLFLPIWIQKRWGEWQSYGGGGYWISHAPDIKNHWFAGWLVQKDISAQFTVGGEIFHTTEQTNGQGSSTGFNVGGYYNFDEHNHLLYSVGKGLQNTNLTNQFSLYLGYESTW